MSDVVLKAFAMHFSTLNRDKEQLKGHPIGAIALAGVAVCWYMSILEIIY